MRKRKVRRRTEGRVLIYPNHGKSKTFHIKCERKLSSVEKIVLNSLNKKYLYYAIDDILSLLKVRSVERTNILSILYSPVLSLQNNLSVSFFDIWIKEIYISERPRFNKFLLKKSSNFETFNYITIEFLYIVRTPKKKADTLW